MKLITVFEAKDGRRFDAQVECVKYEEIINNLDYLFAMLYPLPQGDNCSFVNGNGYIQQNKSDVSYVADKFYELACKYHKGLIQYPFNSYGFWRTLSDCNSPFYKYGFRLTCIDMDTLREYGQPYFKNNPHNAKGGRIN